MTKKIFLGLIVLLVVLGLVYLLTYKKNKNVTTVGPILSVSAFNETKNADAAAVTASPGDTIVYTLSAESPNDKAVAGFVMEINITDLNPYVSLIDAQGANFNSSTNSLIWTPLDISKNGTLEKKFTVKVNDNLPVGSATPLKVKFNNELTVIAKKQQVAGAVTDYKAPVTGPSEWVSLLAALLTTASVFVARSKLKMI